MQESMLLVVGIARTLLLVSSCSEKFQDCELPRRLDELVASSGRSGDGHRRQVVY